MKTTRKIVSFEIETNLPAAAFKHATIRISQAGGRWNGAKIEYLNQPQVNVIRASTVVRKRAGRG